MRSALCVHWPRYVVSQTLRLIGRPTNTQRIPAFFTRFIWLAPDGLRRLPRFRVFGSTLLLCSRRRQSNLRSCPSQERDSCFSASLAVRSIGFLLLPELGVILHVSRWPAPVCVLRTIQPHRQMMHTNGSPLSGSP